MIDIDALAQKLYPLDWAVAGKLDAKREKNRKNLLRKKAKKEWVMIDLRQRGASCASCLRLSVDFMSHLVCGLRDGVYHLNRYGPGGYYTYEPTTLDRLCSDWCGKYDNSIAQIPLPWVEEWMDQNPDSFKK